MKKKMWIALLCVVLVFVPSVIALAGTSTSTTKTVSPGNGAITYYLTAKITTSSSGVYGTANVAASEVVGAQYMGAAAYVYDAEDSSLAAFGSMVYNSSSTQGLGRQASVASPVSGHRYNSKGYFRLKDGAGNISYYQSYYTGNQTYNGSKGANLLGKGSADEEVIWYEVNENGEIYGTITALDELQELGYQLELAYAQNEDGVYGYVRLSELGFWLESDEDVIRWSKQQDELSYVNLYDADGETILGQFRLTGETVDAEETGLFDEKGAPEKIEITSGMITQEDGISYEYWYAFNEKGEAYGNMDGIFELYEQGTSLGQLKQALVEIVGEDGVRGYAKCCDLGMWQNNEEAQDWMEHLDEYERMEHPLYAADGETVIGAWKFSESVTVYPDIP